MFRFVMTIDSKYFVLFSKYIRREGGEKRRSLQFGKMLASKILFLR